MGANSFWAEAPRNICQVHSREPRHNTASERKECTDTFVWILSIFCLLPLSVSLGPSHRPALCLSLEPLSFLLEISQDFPILLSSSRTPAVSLRKSRHLSKSSSVHSTYISQGLCENPRQWTTRSTGHQCWPVSELGDVNFPHGSRAQTLEPDGLGENPSYVTYELHTVGQLLPVKKPALRVPRLSGFPVSKTGVIPAPVFTGVCGDE